MSTPAPTIWEPLDPPVLRPRMPRHIAIIMDGNGRWANRRNLIRVKGHEAGAEAVRKVVRYCGQIHLEALTLYAFSSENWQRPAAEVHFLMRLLRKYLIHELPELHANGVCLRSIGRTEKLPKNVRDELYRCQEATAKNTGLNLCLALNYGAHDELVDAARSLAEGVVAGELSPAEIDVDAFTKKLHTAELPPVDLLIRTAGEQRVSNFLLWQACEAEFHVTNFCWPEMEREQLEAAIIEFDRRRQGAASQA